jgi:hypothetical protein
MMIRLFKRCFSSSPTSIAELLNSKYSVNIEPPQIPIDPRGMKYSKLKQLLRKADYKEPVPEELHEPIIKEWQNLFDNKIFTNIKLPGHEKAGPMTFKKVNDEQSIPVMYDKHGRVEH